MREDAPRWLLGDAAGVVPYSEVLERWMEREEAEAKTFQRIIESDMVEALRRLARAETFYTIGAPSQRQLARAGRRPTTQESAMEPDENLLDLTPEQIAQRVDATQGFAPNGDYFMAAAEKLVGPWRTIYEQAPPGSTLRRLLLVSARDQIGRKFVDWDEKYGWDFPNKPDAVEDVFLYMFGSGLAYSVLTGTLVGALGGHRERIEATRASM